MSENEQVNIDNVLLLLSEFANRIQRFRRFHNTNDTEITFAFCSGVFSMMEINDLGLKEAIEFFERSYVLYIQEKDSQEIEE